MLLTDARVLSSPWRRHGLTVLLVWAGLLGLFSQTVVSLAAIWSSSETYAHGYIVPLISLWLIWRIRPRLLALEPSPSPSAVLLMAGAALLWLAGDMVAVNVVTHVALIALVVLTVPALLGWTVARAMTFPLLFLFFAAPVGDFMLPWLMERTADFTVLALRLSGIPVYREGLQFVIPSGNWSVVEACSGIRYLIASLMVGCLFAYLSYRSLRKRLLFMLVALLVPLLANWVRAYLIVMIGHLSGNELATGVDHLIYGWLFFGFVILVMLLVGARWTDPAQPDAPAAAPAPAKHSPASGMRALWWVGALLALVLVAPHLLLRGLQASVRGQTPVMAAVPAQSPWQNAVQAGASWSPAFQNPSAQWKGSYSSADGHAVDLGVSYYRQQIRERKLVSSSNVLVVSDDAHWSRVEQGSHSVALDGQPLALQTATLRARGAGLTSEGQRLRVWRFYWVGGRFTASDVQAKLLGALALLQGQGDDAAIVVLATPLDDRQPETGRTAAADQQLGEFLRAHASALHSALVATREGR